MCRHPSDALVFDLVQECSQVDLRSVLKSPVDTRHVLPGGAPVTLVPDVSFLDGRGSSEGVDLRP
jgi:hypothetical protein